MTPFANYKDFDACVVANRGRVSDPEAYCASIQGRTDHSNPNRQGVIAATFTEGGDPDKFAMFHVALWSARGGKHVVKVIAGILDPPDAIEGAAKASLRKTGRMSGSMVDEMKMTGVKALEVPFSANEPVVDQFAQYEVTLREANTGDEVRNHKIVINAPAMSPEWELLRLAQDAAQDLGIVPLKQITDLRFVSVRSLEVPFGEFLAYPIDRYKEGDSTEKFEEWAFDVTMRRVSGDIVHDPGERISGNIPKKGTRKQETVTFPLYFDWKPTDAELLSKGQEIATMMAGADRWVVHRSILRPRRQRSASNIRAIQKAEARRRMSQEVMARRSGGTKSSRLTADQLRKLRDDQFGEGM